MVKVILGSFGALPIFDNLVSRKWLVPKRDGVKFGPVLCVHRVLLAVKCLRSFRGSFGAVPIFDNLVSRKRLVVKRNGVKFDVRG